MTAYTEWQPENGYGVLGYMKTSAVTPMHMTHTQRLQASPTSTHWQFLGRILLRLRSCRQLALRQLPLESHLNRSQLNLNQRLEE